MGIRGAPLPAKSEVRRPGDRNGQLEHDRYCAANSYTIGPIDRMVRRSRGFGDTKRFSIDD